MHIFFYPNRKFNECSDVFLGCASPAGSSEFMGKTFQAAQLMPSPSASSKFVLSVLKFLGTLKFLRCTQNSLGISTQMSQFM